MNGHDEVMETAEDLYTPSQWRIMATEPDLIRQESTLGTHPVTPACCRGHACDRCATCMSGRCCATTRTSSASASDAAADDRLTEQYIEAAHKDHAVGHPLLRAFAIDRLHALLRDGTAAPAVAPNDTSSNGERSPLAAALEEDLARGLAAPALRALPAPSASHLLTVNKEATRGES